MVTKEEKSKIGKKSRRDGGIFERKVRLDLESKGWIVIKNPNNVIEETKLVEDYAVHAGNNNWIKRLEPEVKKVFKQGKSKFNPFTKRLMMNSGGFPDFIAYRTMELTPIDEHHYEIIGVESKINGRLDREERDKAKWLIENNILSRILIASKNEDSINKIKFEDLK